MSEPATENSDDKKQEEEEEEEVLVATEGGDQPLVENSVGESESAAATAAPVEQVAGEEPVQLGERGASSSTAEEGEDTGDAGEDSDTQATTAEEGPAPSEQAGDTAEGVSGEEVAVIAESEQPLVEDTTQSSVDEASTVEGAEPKTATEDDPTPSEAIVLEEEDYAAEEDTPSAAAAVTPTVDENADSVEPMEECVALSSSEHPSTPYPGVLEDIREEEEEEEEEVVDKEELLERCRAALGEQERLHSLNTQLQHKIAEYLARKKTDDRPDPGRNVTDQEKRYIQCMAGVETLQHELQSMQEGFDQQEMELKGLRDHKLAEVQRANAGFAEYKKQHVMTAVHSRSGKRLTAQEVDSYHISEDRKETEVTQVRLENIKLQNKIAKQESLLKQKEQLAEGLHMIDFEQLKINNVDLNEKIEERNEDILKLRKKVTATVEVLTHVKEKLQFLQAENLEKKAQLRALEEVVAKKRDHLTRLKQNRDALRTDNIRLRQRGGLVSHSALLRDFEERRDQNEELQEQLERLQQRHSELSVQCEGYRNRIEQARLLHPRMS